MRERILNHLKRLVASNTTNPPRAINSETGACAHAARTLFQAGFAVTIDDLGDGSVNILALRGSPSVLVNCHLDTVPPCEGWQGDPFTLSVTEDRAVGLGACDVKGAAACILAAAETTQGDAAILFTSDEEAGIGRCVRAFCDTQPEWVKLVLVSEPTQCRAVHSHRGLLSCEVAFTGTGGHSSLAESRSALHDLVRFASAALDALGDDGPANRFNIGRVEGGIKPNMIAASATIRFGMRPAPGVAAESLLARIRQAIPAGATASWHVRFAAPALAESAAALEGVRRLGLPVGAAVDFWTEAALFAEAGLPAAVCGPGRITEAHTPGEFIALSQLDEAARMYGTLFSGSAPEESEGQAWTPATTSL